MPTTRAMAILLSPGARDGGGPDRTVVPLSTTSSISDRERIMPRGDKSAYTDKQKRKAEHIEEGYEKRDVPEDEAERRAWATVNKESGGGKKSGSGRGKRETHVAARRQTRRQGV